MTIRDLLSAFGLPIDFLKRVNVKPRRCSFKIREWQPVTGEIFAMRSPFQYMHLDPSEMICTARYPWGDQ